jgi:DNA-binding PucR family transcriptional regulator
MATDVQPIVAEVVRAIDADLSTLTDELTDHFLDVIPEFRQDEAARQLMVASTSSNLINIFDILRHGIDLDDITVPTAAAEYARRFAQRQLSLEALLRAYRLGQHRVVQWALHYLATLDLGAADTIAATQRIALVTNRYIDEVTGKLIDIYESERQRWHHRSDSARAAQLRAVLQTESLDLASAEQILNISLRGWHQAVIVWVETTGGNPERALGLANRLLHEAAGREPLSMLADTHTLWAWISSAGRPSLDVEFLRGKLADHPAVHVALGELSSGLAGFRSSHRQALRARAVAETALHPELQVVEFDQVAIAALLSDNLEDVRSWVASTLGHLARDDEGTARLRETVRVFLQCGGSYTDAATRLHLHKNTVNYRARKAEELIGHPLGERRLDIEVALLLCDLLGRRVMAAG